MSTLESMRAFAQRAKVASRVMASATTEQKNRALVGIAAALRARSVAIVEANALDLTDAQVSGKNVAFLDRLLLDPARVEAMATAVEFIGSLEDPIGEVTESWRRPNGLEIRKVRLPLGVVLMIYESRPNVTSDAAALCVKSGNVALLRGGSEGLTVTEPRENRIVCPGRFRTVKPASMRSADSPNHVTRDAKPITCASVASPSGFEPVSRSARTSSGLLGTSVSETPAHASPSSRSSWRHAVDRQSPEASHETGVSASRSVTNFASELTAVDGERRRSRARVTTSRRPAGSHTLRGRSVDSAPRHLRQR